MRRKSDSSLESWRKIRSRRRSLERLALAQTQKPNRIKLSTTGPCTRNCSVLLMRQDAARDDHVKPVERAVGDQAVPGQDDAVAQRLRIEANLPALQFGHGRADEPAARRTVRGVYVILGLRRVAVLADSTAASLGSVA